MGVCCTREDNKNKCIDVPPATNDQTPVTSEKDRIVIDENDNSVVITSFNTNTELHYNVKYKPRKQNSTTK